MTDMLVNYSSLAALSEAMTQASAQSAANVENMDAELRPTQSDWSGQAQQQYTIAMAECRAALNDMQTQIGRLGAHVSTSSANYNSTDSSAAGLFGA
ncbi:WXG100 family type VII secretion target [Actinomyces sp. 2119]|uniref:ESAT-6-like protein n=1 Tax=Actinomyces lilanjuaniae TaxID=2321394 RepID=A0ABM6Z1W4_9ACTO|nr:MULTISPECIES: WXG100 family type VII secretion target [Actinomyces]AYD88941.1 WXG100 family type VII secretion target [Actinomyces lilanjuaniae]RJF41222.1 WXG100 family type VII secretion target [Actinomyces sp. 2119]